MSLFTLAQAAAHMYFISLAIAPDEIVQVTSLFLSLAVPTSRKGLALHLARCCCLLLVFVVLYTSTGLRAIKELLWPASKEVPSSTSKPSSLQLLLSSSLPSSSPSSSKQQTITSNAPITTPMRSTADLTIINNNNKQTEPIVNSRATPSRPVDTPLVDRISPSKDDKQRKITQLINNDVIIYKQQDRTKDVQVIPMELNREHVRVVAQQQPAAIPVKTPETSTIIPQQPHTQQQIQHDSGSSSSSETTENISNDDSSSNKSRFYEEINKKGTNIVAFSDNLDRIFDEPPTPSLDHNLRPFSMIHPSVTLPDEAIAITQALTPQNQSSAAGSMLSRKSSTVSQRSSLLKSVFQKPNRSSTVNNNKQENSVVNPAPSTLPKKKRLLSLRLNGKKSSSDNDNNSPANTVDHTQQGLSSPAPKRSISTKLLKGTKKRLSKLFS